MLAALNLIEPVRRDALDAVAVPNKTSLVNQRDDDPGDSGHEDIAGEQIRIERADVNDGGQAIIGTVRADSKGESE
jgi:hypothetical protein